MDYLDKIKQNAEYLQIEMHGFIDRMVAKNPKLEYQDCVVTYLLMKIAKLEIDKIDKDQL
jgi:hypothetical protein